MMRIKIEVLQFVLECLVFLPLGLVFASVFALSDTMAMGVISAKTFWFYGAMGICGLTTTAYFVFCKQFKISFSLSDLLLFLFTLVGLLPFLTRAEAVNSKCVVLAMLVVLYLHFRMALGTLKISPYLLQLFLLFAALVEAVWGMAQLYGYLPSQHNLFLLTGSFFNPGPYAGYLAMLSPLALYYVLWDYRVLKLSFTARVSLFYLRWVLAALALLAIVLVLPASMSRAAWLASASGCGLVVFSFLASRYKLKAYIIRYTKILPVIALLAILLVSGGGYAMYKLKKDSADGRALIWKNSLTAIQDNPFGVGLGHFAGVYGKVQAAYFELGAATEHEQTVAGNPEYAFNEYLQIALEFGIVGLWLFVAAFIMLIIKGMRERKFGAVGALISLLVFAAMSYPISVLPFLIVLVYLLADLVAEAENSNRNHPKASVLLPNRMIYVILILNSCVLAFCLYNRYPTYSAYKDWNDAKMLYNMQLYADALPEYERIEPHLNDRVEFLFEYGQILSKTAHYQKSNEILAKAATISCDPMLYNVMGKNFQALKNYSAAEQNYRLAANIVPSRVYPYYLLAKLHKLTGDSIKFKETAKLVMQKEPKIHSPAIDEMRDEIEALLKTEK